MWPFSSKKDKLAHKASETGDAAKETATKAGETVVAAKDVAVEKVEGLGGWFASKDAPAASGSETVVVVPVPVPVAEDTAPAHATQPEASGLEVAKEKIAGTGSKILGMLKEATEGAKETLHSVVESSKDLASRVGEKVESATHAAAVTVGDGWTEAKTEAGLLKEKTTQTASEGWEATKDTAAHAAEKLQAAKDTAAAKLEGAKETAPAKLESATKPTTAPISVDEGWAAKARREAEHLKEQAHEGWEAAKDLAVKAELKASEGWQATKEVAKHGAAKLEGTKDTAAVTVDSDKALEVPGIKDMSNATEHEGAQIAREGWNVATAKAADADQPLEGAKVVSVDAGWEAVRDKAAEAGDKLESARETAAQKTGDTASFVNAKLDAAAENIGAAATQAERERQVLEATAGKAGTLEGWDAGTGLQGEGTLLKPAGDDPSALPGRPVASGGAFGKIPSAEPQHPNLPV